MMTAFGQRSWRRRGKTALPVTEQDITISRGNGEITVTVVYTIPIVFPGYTYNWHIEHSATNPIF